MDLGRDRRDDGYRLLVDVGAVSVLAFAVTGMVWLWGRGHPSPEPARWTTTVLPDDDVAGAMALDGGTDGRSDALNNSAAPAEADRADQVDQDPEKRTDSGEPRSGAAEPRRTALPKKKTHRKWNRRLADSLVRAGETMRGWTLLVTLTLGASGAAVAAPKSNGMEAESLLRKGVQLRRAGAHAEALEAFLRAHADQPSGRTVAQIGLARESLKQWLRAADSLGEALNTREAWVDKNRAPLEEALASIKMHIGWLSVTGPSGARLWLNETPAGMLPLKEIRLEEGTYVVRVENQGSKPWSQPVTVAGGRLAEVVAMLEEAPTMAVDATARPAFDVEATRDGRWDRAGQVAGAGVLGAGLAVAVTGAVVWIQQERGSYGSFDSGGTGPGLLVGGVVGMFIGGALMYWGSRPVPLGLHGRDTVLSEAF